MPAFYVGAIFSVAKLCSASGKGYAAAQLSDTPLTRSASYYDSFTSLAALQRCAAPSAAVTTTAQHKLKHVEIWSRHALRGTARRQIFNASLLLNLSHAGRRAQSVAPQRRLQPQGRRRPRSKRAPRAPRAWRSRPTKVLRDRSGHEPFRRHGCVDRLRGLRARRRFFLARRRRRRRSPAPRRPRPRGRRGPARRRRSRRRRRDAQLGLRLERPRWRAPGEYARRVRVCERPHGEASARGASAGRRRPRSGRPRSGRTAASTASQGPRPTSRYAADMFCALFMF